MAERSFTRIIILGLALGLVAAGLALILGRGCWVGPPPVTPTSTSVLNTPQNPTSTPTLAQATRTPVEATSVPITPTATPTARNSTTATVAPTVVRPTATPDLVGRHRVVRGDTMWDIGLVWYVGRYFAWGEDVWRPICDTNPHIANCRLIYPGDELAIPRLRP